MVVYDIQNELWNLLHLPNLKLYTANDKWRLLQGEYSPGWHIHLLIY